LHQSEDKGGSGDTASILQALVAASKRLAGADWFTAKVSACGMIAPVLQLQNELAGGSSNNSNQELLNLYRELCHDDTPMVRRSAAKHLGSCLKQAGPTQHGRDFALQTLPLLIRDEQDSVRMLAAASMKDTGPDFGKANPQWTAQNWLPLVKDGSTDMSW